MSIQEEITALLNGELVDEASVAELMHVLAVSPEKRQLMVEQIRMSRGYSALGSSLAPPGRADERIWQGIHAVDAGFVPMAAAAAPAAGFLMLGRIGLLSLLALMLIGVGIGTGYLLGFDYAVNPPASAQMAAQEDPTFLLLATAQDSLDASRRQIQDLGAGYDRALARISELQGLDSARSAALARQSRRVAELEKSIAALSRRNIPEPVRVIEGTRLLPPPPGEIRLKLIGPVPHPEPLPVEAPGKEVAAIEPSKSVRPYQVGLRRNFRTSFPRVYGLSEPSAFKDYEGVISLPLDEKTGADGARFSVAFGQTQFSQIFHTNKSDVGIDQIIRQTPELEYVRGFASLPLLGFDLFGVGDFRSFAELGAGGTVIGPVGTLGLDLQLAFSDQLSVNGGASTWMLATMLEDETYTSFNLNLYFGAAIAF